MLTLADIATGDTGTADVLFLIAAILFGVIALIRLARPANATLEVRLLSAFVPAGLCLVAIGLMLQ